MSGIVKLSFSGHGADTDAPTVEDVLDQVRDYLDILHGVEMAIADDGMSAIEWRIVNASKASPLTFALGPYSKNYATNIDQRVGLVNQATATGLAMLEERAERPAYFTDDVMKRALRVFSRVTNGLAISDAEFGEGLPISNLTPTKARQASRNVGLVLQPQEKPYQALGSVEGYLQGAELDGFGRRVIYIKARITGNSVKCILGAAVQADLQERHLSDVWAHRRVMASGRIHYKSLSEIRHIETESLRFLRNVSALPQIDDVIDENFTGGLKSEDYLRGLHDGTLS